MKQREKILKELEDSYKESKKVKLNWKIKFGERRRISVHDKFRKKRQVLRLRLEAHDIAKKEVCKEIENVLKCSSYSKKEIGFTCNDEDCISCNYKKELKDAIKGKGEK